MVGYDNFLKDFACRTMTNLKFIEENAPRFKVTQLINSFLGLFIFAQQSGHPMPEHLDPNGSPLSSKNYAHFRNAISHCHIEQIVQNGEICGLRLWDQLSKNHSINWDQEFTVDELRTIMDQMHAHLIESD